MRTSPLTFAIWLLAFTTAVLANPFWNRQDATTSSSASTTVPPSSGAPEAPASTTGTAPPAEATPVNGTTATSSGVANGTAAATSSASAAATSSVYLDDTPEELRCHIEREEQPEDNIANAFCSPEQGEHLNIGQTYNVTWDPSLFPHNNTNTVKLTIFNGTNTTQIGGSGGLANEKGYWTMELFDDYVTQYHLTTNSNLTLFIESKDAEGNPSTNSGPKSGPVFFIMTNSTSNSTSHSDDGDSDVGKKAGIPVGLGLFLIAAAGLIFWFLRRRKRNAAGYLGKRSRSARMTGDESGVGASGFRDEPTRGLELQDRAGHGREDSWEAGWDTSSSQGGGGGGGGNAFRDEIDRQRRR